MQRVAAFALLQLALIGCSAGGPSAEPAGAGTPAAKPALLAAVAAPDGSSTVRIPAEFVRADDDGRAIVIRVTYADLCQTLLGAHVEEAETTVRVVAVGTQPTDVCPPREAIGQFRVPLSEPLGDRTVSSA